MVSRRECFCRNGGKFIPNATGVYLGWRRCPFRMWEIHQIKLSFPLALRRLQKVDDVMMEGGAHYLLVRRAQRQTDGDRVSNLWDDPCITEATVQSYVGV